MRSLLRYPGGKSRAISQIRRLLPPDVQRVCSPFIGGGSFELDCISRGIEVVGYDRLTPLVSFWQELISDASALATKARKMYPMSSKQFSELQKKCLTTKSRIEQAAIFYVLNRASFSGTTLVGGMSPGHPRFTLTSIERLREFKITGLSVECADFTESIERHGDDFLYLDPPYLINSTIYGARGDSNENFDHAALAQLLKARKSGGWILSYNDTPLIRQLYPENHYMPASWAYGMNTTKKSNEILIISDDVYEQFQSNKQIQAVGT